MHCHIFATLTERDDAARSEFLNKRRAKGELAGPAESQSNLWFVHPAQIDRLGRASGHAGLFVDDWVEAGQWSDPMLFAGYDHRAVHLVHDASQMVRFRFETDAGDGQWKPLRKIEVGVGVDVDVGAAGYEFHAFAGEDRGAWVRVSTDRACKVTVWFEYRDRDPRRFGSEESFKSLGGATTGAIGGLLRAGDRQRGLQILATALDGNSSQVTGYYELKPNLTLTRVESREDAEWMRKQVAIPTGVVTKEGNSMLYVDDDGQRWRLPIGNPVFGAKPKLLDLQRSSGLGAGKSRDGRRHEQDVALTDGRHEFRSESAQRIPRHRQCHDGDCDCGLAILQRHAY